MKDFWNQRYQEIEYAYGTQANDFLQKNIKYFPINSKILSLADGEGRNSVFLARNGFTVEAVDFSEAAKIKALDLAKKYEVSIKYDIANLEDYQFQENNYDGIIAIFAHTNNELRLKIFQEVKKSLKIGGIFLLEGYNSKQLLRDSGGPKDLDMFFDKDQLIASFKNFEILHCQNVVRKIREGKYHNGDSDVVQFIARKLS